MIYSVNLCSQIYWDKQKYVDIGSDILSPIREEFYRFFLPTNHLHDFEIVFYYSSQKDKCIKWTPWRINSMLESGVLFVLSKS